jgi:DNA-binding MarR family transcriptional regulator
MPSGEANLLGALALIVTDRTTDAIVAAGGQSDTAAAALSALDHFLDRPTIDRLRRVLGLTPSGTVRLVDRLAAVGYVTRDAGADGRSRAVVLTEEGRRAAERIAAARAAVLENAVADLSPTERATLRGLLGKVMATIVHDKTDGVRWICRLCDLAACGRDEGDCPTANAAAARRAVHESRPASPHETGAGTIPEPGRPAVRW